MAFLLVANGFDVVQANNTLALHLNAVSRRRARRRTADVEGAHGQLGAGFTDGLGSDHTHSFTQVDQVTTGQIATIALGANPVASLAGDGRTHLDLVC